MRLCLMVQPSRLASDVLSDLAGDAEGPSRNLQTTEIEVRRGAPLRLWILAAVGALAFHAVALAAAANYLKPEETEDDLGAPAMEVGIELAAPHLEQTDLPPGPPADDSTASPAVVAQQANEKQSQLPKDDPIETDDPMRLVSPDASAKPTEDKPIVKTVDASPSAESQASQAAAPPVADMEPPSERSTAPVQGIGHSDQRVKMNWEKELAVHIDKHKRYPPNGRRRTVQVLVSFTIDRMGHVLSASVVGGSGDAAFNSAAISMVQRSDPVPPPPPAVADEGLTFTLPVIFKAKGNS